MDSPRPLAPSPAVARPPRGGSALPRAWMVPAAFGLVALLGVLVYLPGLRGGFVFDDFSNIVHQPAFAPRALHEHFWGAVWAGRAGPFGRELSTVSFAAQILLWGMSAAPMKLFNLLLHLFNGALVAVLTLRVVTWVHGLPRDAAPHAAAGTDAFGAWVLPPRAVAVLVAAAWLLAPIQLTAVLYIVQREEALAAAFVLLGLLGYWHGRMLLLRAGQGGGSRRRAWAWMWISLLAGTLLGTLAKETGVMLPAYAAVLEWVVLRGEAGAAAGSPEQRELRCGLLAMFVLVLVLPGSLGLAWLLPQALHGGYAARPFTLAQRLLTEGRVLVDYLHWTLLPRPDELSLYHDDLLASTGWCRPWTTAASWALLAALALVGLALRRRRPLVALGILWFFVGQSLVSSFVPLELVYEHRNYLPSWGVFLAAFSALGAWSPRRRGSWPVLAGTVCAGLVALYAGFTALRAQVWSTPYRLAYFEATTHPRSPRANYDLGRLLYLMGSGPDSPSFQLASRQMEIAAALPGADMQPMQALVYTRAVASQAVPEAWWARLRAQLVAQPLSAENGEALYSLVQCAVDASCRYTPVDLGRLHDLLLAGVQAHRGDAQLHTLLANYDIGVRHDYPAAYREMLRAVALDPGSFAYWRNLVGLQIAGGQWSQAAGGLERLRELDTFGQHRAELRALGQSLRTAQAAPGAKQGEDGRVEDAR